MIIKATIKLTVNIIRTKNQKNRNESSKSETEVTPQENEPFSRTESYQTLEIYDKPINFKETKIDLSLEKNLENNCLLEAEEFFKFQKDFLIRKFLNDSIFSKDNEPELCSIKSIEANLETNKVLKLDLELSKLNDETDIFVKDMKSLEAFSIDLKESNQEYINTNKSIEINEPPQLIIRISPTRTKDDKETTSESKETVEQLKIYSATELKDLAQLKENDERETSRKESLKSIIHLKIKEPSQTLSNSLSRFAYKFFSKFNCSLGN